MWLQACARPPGLQGNKTGGGGGGQRGLGRVAGPSCPGATALTPRPHPLQIHHRDSDFHAVQGGVAVVYLGRPLLPPRPSVSGPDGGPFASRLRGQEKVGHGEIHPPEASITSATAQASLLWDLSAAI